jgi:hypothetical protein
MLQKFFGYYLYLDSIHINMHVYHREITMYKQYPAC